MRSKMSLPEILDLFLCNLDYRIHTDNCILYHHGIFRPGERRPTGIYFCHCRFQCIPVQQSSLERGNICTIWGVLVCIWIIVDCPVRLLTKNLSIRKALYHKKARLAVAIRIDRNCQHLLFFQSDPHHLQPCDNFISW